MKKCIIAIAALTVFVCAFAFAAQPTWVGVQVNTNTGEVKPTVLEGRLGLFLPIDHVDEYEDPADNEYYVGVHLFFTNLFSAPGIYAQAGSPEMPEDVYSVQGWGDRLSFEEHYFRAGGDFDVYATNGTINFMSTNRIMWNGVGLARTNDFETCKLYWSTNYVLGHIGPNATLSVPTNFPSRSLYLVVNDWATPELNIDMPVWVPNRDVEINLLAIRQSGGNTNRATTFFIGGSEAFSSQGIHLANYNQYRLAHYEWDARTQSWNTELRSMAYRSFFFDSTGNKYSYPEWWPETVDEWESMTSSGVENLQMLTAPQFVSPVAEQEYESSEDLPDESFEEMR